MIRPTLLYLALLWVFADSFFFPNSPELSLLKSNFKLDGSSANSSSFANDMRSLEDLIREASEEKSENERINKLNEIKKRKIQLKKKADKEYDAYWEREASRGGSNKEQATMKAYYSLKKNETLQSKLKLKEEEFDYEIRPRSPKQPYLSAAALTFLVAGAVILKKGSTLSLPIATSSKSNLLDSRLIRQSYSYGDLKSSIQKLTPNTLKSLPDIPTEVFSSLAPLTSQVDATPVSSATISSNKLTVLLYWRPSDAASMRALSIMKALQIKCPDINFIPILAPKYPFETMPSKITSLLLSEELPQNAFIDRDLNSWRKLGCNVWPTIVVMAPPSLIQNKVLFAMEGQRAVNQVLGNALAATAASAGGGEGGGRNIMNSFSSTPLLKPSVSASVGVVKSLSSPSRLAINPLSGLRYISDTGHHRILEIDQEGNVLRIWGAKNGESGASVPGCGAGEARFNRPIGIAVDAYDSLVYVADFGNDAVRRINLKDGSVISVSAADVDRDGEGMPYDFQELSEIETELGKKLKDFGSMTAEEVQRALLKRKLTDNPLARQIVGRTRPMLGPVDVAKSDAFIYVSSAISRQVWRIEGSGFLMRPTLGSGLPGKRDVLEVKDVNAVLSDGLRFIQPAGIVSLGSKLIVVDSDAGSVRSVDVVSQVTSTLIEGERNNPTGDDDGVSFGGFGDIDAPGYKGRLQVPTGACKFFGNSLLVADTMNNKIKRLVITSSDLMGQRVDVSTVLEGDSLLFPQGVAVDLEHKIVYVADTGHNRILTCDTNFGTLKELKINFDRI